LFQSVGKAKGGGKDAAEQYAVAFLSPTERALAANKKKYSALTAAYLAAEDDSALYPVSSGGWFNRKGSSSAESWNNCVDELRELPFVDAVMKAGTMIRDRHRKNKAAAEAHAALNAPLPPNVETELRPVREWAAQMPPSLVTLSVDGLTAMVKSTLHQNVHRVTFDAIKNRVGDQPCDKGCCVHATVCGHVLAACRKKNVSVVSLMNPRDTTTGWVDQYRATIDVPSTEEIESHMHLRDETLLMPPALKRKAGRPEKRKRRAGGLEAGMKRKMHCKICGKGHHKHRCPTVVPCAQCRQLGHFKRDCPSSKKK
jgi:hypothetical protein